MNRGIHPTDIDQGKAISIEIPTVTILKIVVAILLLKLGVTIVPLLLPLTMAILIAVSLMPALAWLMRYRVSRSEAVASVALAMAAGLITILIAIVPSVYHELMAFIRHLPEFREEILEKIGSGNPIHGIVSHGLRQDVFLPKAHQYEEILGAGNIVLGGFSEVLLTFILSIYLVADGPRLIEWVSAFFEPNTQNKIDQTAAEVSKIISAYVIGQFLTSALSFLFVLIAMELLKVPNALLLATLAGILDVLPVLGFFLAVIPAMLFAANVDINLTWIVLGVYLFYHTLENYLIVPWVYGNKMRVSSFVVFFTLLAAGLVGGIEGAIVALPIVASYPILERIWLRRYIRQEAVIDHAASQEFYKPSAPV